MTTRAPRLDEAARERMHRLYRRLHADPELSMVEHRTARLLQQHLTTLGLETFRCAGTGVVGILRNGQGPVVAYRADIDGLPVAEETGIEYASAATGTLPDGTVVPVMHACGHDAHTAVALSTVELLARHPKAWSGTLVLILQPGEETAEGARAMVEDGLWERAPLPEVVLGQHVAPAAAGTVLCASGIVAAAADSLRVTVRGRGGHAARPEQTVDPVLLAAHMVVRLQGVVSREVPPLRAATVTVGTIHGGTKENVIPASVELTLNIRTFDPSTRRTVLSAIRRILDAEATASGAEPPVVEELNAFPLCHNDPDATDRVTAALQDELGDEQVLPSGPYMGSEDFGTLAAAIGAPSVYWLFGGLDAEQLDRSPVPGNHSALFAPCLEPTLTTGVRAAVAALLAWLRVDRPGG